MIGIANIVAALAILLVGIALGRLSEKFIKRLLVELEIGKYFKFPVEKILSQIAAYTVYIVALIIALINLGISKTILYFLLFAILAIIAVSVFLALKDFIPNMLAGIKLHKRGLITGDQITSVKLKGKVEELGLTDTKLKAGREVIFVPNSLLTREILKVKVKAKIKAKTKVKKGKQNKK